MYRNVNSMNYTEEREAVQLYNEGQKIFAIFHKPRNLLKFPAVLFCHGLAGNKVGRYRIYVLLAEALAMLGIGCLRFDFRGCGDSEGEFHKVTIGSMVSDTGVALNYLKEQPHVDTSRFGIFGRSMGTSIAVLAACCFQQFKSIALWAPVFHGKDWMDLWKKAETFSPHSDEFKELLTIEGQIPGADFFREFFSMKLEKELHLLDSVPMLLIHGSHDTIVRPDHSKSYLNNRSGVSSETKYIELPKSDHHFSNLNERDLAVKETCRWFMETLNV